MHKNMTLVNDIATQAYKTKFLFKYFASITVRYSIMQLLSGTQVAGSFRATWTLVYLMDCFNILDLQFVHITPLVIRFNNAECHIFRFVKVVQLQKMEDNKQQLTAAATSCLETFTECDRRFSTTTDDA